MRQGSSGIHGKVILVALFLLCPSSSHAAGINLSWNDCGLAGISANSFSCNSNAGTNIIVGSYLPPAGISALVGLSASLSISTVFPLLPDWWKHGTGQCRGNTGLSVSSDFTGGPFTCVDVFTGQAAGGLAYDINFGTPNAARLRIQFAVPEADTTALNSTTEYYAFKVNLLHTKTVGADSCFGCLIPATVNLDSLQLFQPAQHGFDPIIRTAAQHTSVTWQLPLSPTSVRQTTTWGRLRQRYR
jgi:hypothetical protein